MVIKLALLLGAAVSVLCALFVSTDPDQLPAAVFVGVFILLYAILFLSLGIAGLLAKKTGLISWRVTRIVRMSALLAGLPVFLLGLQSIGQLTFRDFLLAAGLLMLLYFYFNRLAAQKST